MAKLKPTKKVPPPSDQESNLFIAWGGRWSENVALALYHWLPKMIDAVKPWMSKESIRSGANWFNEITKQLGTVQAAIVCLTPDNLDNPWIHFEAGAIVNRGLAEARVIPYLIDSTPNALSPPLSLLQGQMAADQAGSFKLVKDVNWAIGGGVSEGTLKERFDGLWEEFNGTIENAKPTEAKKPRKRETSEMFEEMLAISRATSVGLGKVLEVVQNLYRPGGAAPPGGARTYTDLIREAAAQYEQPSAVIRALANSARRLSGDDLAHFVDELQEERTIAGGDPLLQTLRRRKKGKPAPQD